MSPRLLAAGAVLAAAAAVYGQEPSKPREWVTFTPAQVGWGPAPPMLPKGAMGAVLAGDPAAAGPFTLRVKFPPGYVLPPHRHLNDEFVTVLEGTVMIGVGERFDKAALRALGPGSLSIMPGGTPHFVSSPDGATIQSHGMGPFPVDYVDPGDDPRSAAAK